jgi:hypothetical protein
MKSKYRVHRFDIRMTRDQLRLQEFLNNLKGEIISIVPNTTVQVGHGAKVDFLFIVEKKK